MRAAIFALLCFTAPAAAQQAPNSNFHPGTYITQFGPIASVDSDQPIPKKAKLKVRFDVTDGATAGEVNRSMVSAARFLNMSIENGVAPENIRLAIVIHGSATKDMTNDARYARDKNAPNANAPLVAALLDKGVDIYVCGQSAAANEVARADLLPGVKMSLSAMHAHALLDAEGYSLNPF